MIKNYDDTSNYYPIDYGSIDCHHDFRGGAVRCACPTGDRLHPWWLPGLAADWPCRGGPGQLAGRLAAAAANLDLGRGRRDLDLDRGWHPRSRSVLSYGRAALRRLLQT